MWPQSSHGQVRRSTFDKACVCLLVKFTYRWPSRVKRDCLIRVFNNPYVMIETPYPRGADIRVT